MNEATTTLTRAASRLLTAMLSVNVLLEKHLDYLSRATNGGSGTDFPYVDQATEHQSSQ